MHQSRVWAYFVSRDHVEAALRRVFKAAAVQVAATRALDDFLVPAPRRPTSRAARARPLKAAAVSLPVSVVATGSCTA